MPPRSFQNRVACFFALLTLLLSATVANGGIVTISTSTVNGTAGVPNGDDFIGVLTAGSPAPAIETTLLAFNGPIPGGESFQPGDLVGRDIDASGGLRVWTYDLLLPADAVLGTGLENINFDTHSFERNVGNLEDTDELTWELLLNGTVVTSGSIQNDFPGGVFDLNLSDPGGATITQASIRFTVDGYDANNEWFATRGLLSATYQQAMIPEPGTARILAIALASLALRFRRRRSEVG